MNLRIYCMFLYTKTCFFSPAEIGTICFLSSVTSCPAGPYLHIIQYNIRMAYKVLYNRVAIKTGSAILNQVIDIVEV